MEGWIYAIRSTRIPKVVLAETEVHGDERGFFLHGNVPQAVFVRGDISLSFVQDNQSRSQIGVLRILHYHIRHPQGKPVRVVSGDVFDVAVDLRRGWPTFGQWVGVTLSLTNKRQLWIPPGFAHGFYVLTKSADVIYKVTDYYSLESDRTLHWDDLRLAIEWPLINKRSPMVSAKNSQGKYLDEADLYE